MSASTGPILAMGAITLANRTVFNGQPMDWRIPAATGLAAIGGALLEQLLGAGAVRGIALVGLATICLTRVDPKVPSPAESALKWWTTNREE